MTTYDNTNRGVLFKNKDKKTDKHPDRKGTINIEGVEYWLSAWDKDKGVISLSISPKEKKAETKQSNDIDDGEQIPF